MRPTFRAVIFVGAGIPLSLVLAIVGGGLWPLGVAYLGFAVVGLGFDAILTLPKRSLTIQTEAPPLIYIGDGEEFVVALEIEPGRSAVQIELYCDVSEHMLRPPPRVAVVEPAAATPVTFPLWPRRRGTAVIDRLWLRWDGPLGLMRLQTSLHVQAAISIVPNVRSVRTAAIQMSTRDAHYGVKTQSQQGDGTEFEALREYVTGLDHRSIDWKHTARHRKLICKDFQVERNHQIIMAFDTGHLMSEPLGGIPKLDHAINAGLLLSYMSLRSGDRVGLFAFDAKLRHSTGLMHGSHRVHRVLRASADREYQQEETNFTLGLTELLSRLKRRSLIVLQTDFVDTVTAELMVENLKRLSARHLVIFVTLRDPALHGLVDTRPKSMADVARSVIADDFLRERRIVLERLRRHGVHCLEVGSDELTFSLLNRYLMIKRLELI